MGQKAHPIGNRLGIIRGWDSNWFGGSHYADKLVEDVKLFFLEKLNEMDEFIKHRNVYTMELAKSDEHYESKPSEDQEEETKLKKISINTAKTNFSE